MIVKKKKNVKYNKMYNYVPGKKCIGVLSKQCHAKFPKTI